MNQLPLPDLDALTTPFWDGCREQRLLIQQCPETGRLIFPPRHRSPWAPHMAPHWVEASGRGTLWAAAQPHPPLVEPFASLAPYNIVIVALKEDPKIRMVGNIVDEPDGAINASTWETLQPGLPLEVVFQPNRFETGSDAGELWFPRWRVVGD